MNKVFLIGRLTRDPELRYTNANVPVARFTVAVNRTFTNQAGEREADFINVVVWRKQAENVKNYLKQGSQIAIDGRIQTGSYDAQDGTKRYTTEVIADNVQFLDTKSSRDNISQESVKNVTPSDFSNESDAQQQTVPTTNVENDPFADFGSSIEINDDELPF